MRGNSSLQKISLIAAILLALLVSTRTLAGENVKTIRSETMDFDQCVSTVAVVIAQLNASPSQIIPIVNTSILVMTKIV